jgi:hypothetical protein
MADTYSTEEIKAALVKSCLACKPSIFKPYLASEKVNVDDVAKEEFYKFFKYMLHDNKIDSVGELYLKIETVVRQNQQVQEYCFYDAVHMYPRLTIIVKEEADSVYFDILPF